MAQGLKLFASVVLWFAACLPATASDWIEVRSPSGQARVAARTVDGTVQWKVSYRGRPVLAPAAIGLRFAGEPAPVRLAQRGIARRMHDGIVTGLVGKASRAVDRYAEAVLMLDASGDGAPRRRFALVLRAYDDGVAYRWRILDAGAPFALAAEVAGFGLAGDATAWAMPATGFVSSHEQYARTGSLAQAVPPGQLTDLPLLFRLDDDTWGALLEAAVIDWAGLYLLRDAQGLHGTLSPLPDAPGSVVRSATPAHDAPWRVVLLGDAPGRLVESNLVALLNAPADARDWSWVHPGKTTFPWWNDYAWPGAPFTPGLNTATMLAYIDFCADNGIPYHSLDGFRDQAWYGGPIIPDGTPQDLTTATPAIDMDALLAHARERGVRLRLWTHWKPLHDQLDAALDAWARWGIEGIMVDFMDRDDQEMVRFLDDVVRKAADRRMTVTLHGVARPTGEGRTWPNLLTREGVRNLEYNKFDGTPGSTPQHEATVPFTRMLAGPLDYHQGGFDHVAPQAFATRFTRPQVMGTRARALALYVVLENPLPMVADTPVNYRDAAGWQFVVAAPATWDETRVLAGSPGEFIVVARRSGDAWWIGAIGDATARAVAVTLPGAPGAAYRLDGHADARDASPLPLRDRATVRGGSRLVIRMQAAGGYAATLVPVQRPHASPDADAAR